MHTRCPPWTPPPTPPQLDCTGGQVGPSRRGHHRSRRARRPSPRPSARPRKTDIKLIPGVEGYLMRHGRLSSTDADDRLRSTAPSWCWTLRPRAFHTATDRIIEVGAVKLEDGQIVDELEPPGATRACRSNPRSREITGITDLMLPRQGKPRRGRDASCWSSSATAAVAAHNASFDIGMLSAECERMGVALPRAGAGYADLRAQAVSRAEELQAGRGVPASWA